MKPFLILLLSVRLACGSVSGQPVQGIVVDEAQQPVAGIAVIMLDTDSVYVSGTVTDTLGRFSIVSALRPYRLLFQHVAYDPLIIDCDEENVGEVVLHESIHPVGEVIVSGERPVMQIDEGKLTYDLEAVSKDYAVNNAYEALTKLPGVSEQGGRLELAGMGTVAVILNGKPSTMSAEQLAALLKSTPVDRIGKAEVMYSTPPQYHVRGAAINLVMRRSYDDLVSGEIHGSYSSQCYNQLDAGGNLVFSSPGWSADFTYSAGKYKNKRRVDLYSRHLFEEAEYDISQIQDIISETTRHNLRTVVEYTPKDKGHLSATYTAAFSPANSGKIYARGTLVDSHNNKCSDDVMHNVSLRYIAIFGMDVTIDYTHYRTSALMTMKNDYTSNRTTGFDVTSGQTVDRLGLNLDRERRLGKSWQLTYGGAFYWAEDHDKQHYTILEGDIPIENTDSRLTEYTGNLYAGFGKQLSRGSLSLSFSGEYYRLGNYENWSLYPQATFLWMFGDNHLLQLSLSSDKTYPSYWETQEAVSYIDGYSEIHGTPGLRPKRSYNGQVLYMLKRKYIFMLFWNEKPDYFVQTAWQASDRLALIYQTLNWNTNRQWGTNVIVPFAIGMRLDSRLTLTGMRMRQRCDTFHDISFDRSKWIGVARLQNTVRLTKRPDIALDISGYYQSAAIQGTYDIDPSWGLDAGIKWTFFKGRATLTARCRDIFESTIPFTTIRYGSQYLDMDPGAYTRAFTVHFAYRFGGYKEKNKKEIDTSRFGH